jgi:hypothetical protein
MSHKFRDAGDQADAGFGHNALRCVAWRQYNYPLPTLIIDNRLDLAVAAALGDAYRLRFPQLARRWIFT